jgi:hypothetical protein
MTRQKIKGKRKLCTLYSSQQMNGRTVRVKCFSSSSEMHAESLSQIARMEDELEVTDVISPDTSQHHDFVGSWSIRSPSHIFIFVSSKRRSRNIQDDMQQSLSTPGDDCP